LLLPKYLKPFEDPNSSQMAKVPIGLFISIFSVLAALFGIQCLWIYKVITWCELLMS